ncbi:zinc finger protein 62 homolog [Cydia amplana]|uniref:zinc finger protein 62 homolog n=1 Tax=Cydia amplana TaxID=1869771 RepID=UPI002FE63A28
MSLEGSKYVWVELEPVWGGAAGPHTKQEPELTENVKTEVKSEPEENMCVSETAGAGLYLKHEQPESAQNINHAVPEVKAEPKDMSDSEPAQASLYSHIDPEVKAALKAEDQNMCGNSAATIQTGLEHKSAYTSQIDHLVMADAEAERESLCSVSTVAEQALYLKHEIKDGLVVGPEVYHRASFDLAIINPVPERSCAVRLERMHIDMERCVCRIGGNMYKFQLCSEQENDTTDERYSRRSAGDVDEELYKCQSCSFTSVHKHYIRVHKNIAHANEKTWKYKQRKNIEKKPYQCKQCSYASNRKIGLSIHKKVHSKEKALKCNQCDYAHVRKYELEVHINTVHGSEKVYKCDQCKFATVREDIFQSHKKMHTKNIPYKCDECDFATNVKDYLEAHKKTHIVEKPYKCEQCDYDSASETLLGIHKNMMHGAFAQKMSNGKRRKTRRKQNI